MTAARCLCSLHCYISSVGSNIHIIPCFPHLVDVHEATTHGFHRHGDCKCVCSEGTVSLLKTVSDEGVNEEFIYLHTEVVWDLTCWGEEMWWSQFGLVLSARLLWHQTNRHWASSHWEAESSRRRVFPQRSHLFTEPLKGHGAFFFFNAYLVLTR